MAHDEIIPILDFGSQYAQLITIRVLCNWDVWGANGIYERMFLYARKPGPAAPAAW